MTVSAGVSIPLYFVYLQDKVVQQVVCDGLLKGDADAMNISLLGKIDRAKTLSVGNGEEGFGGRYKYVEAVKMAFDVHLDNPDDTRDFLEELEEDIVREHFKPFLFLPTDFDLPTDGVSCVFLFFTQVRGLGGNAGGKIHLEDGVLDDNSLDLVMLGNDLRKTRNFLSIASAVAKKARNRTRNNLLRKN